MAADRVVKYYDDASQLLMISSEATVTKTPNNAKIESQVKKLALWLQKHQNESLPDGIKTKLFSTLELYFRYCSTSCMEDGLIDSVSGMIGDYLQLPEGKLLSSKHKQKVMIWLSQLTDRTTETTDAYKTVPMQSEWTIEGVNEDGSLVLLSTENEELWKEDFVATNVSIYQKKIQSMCAEHETVILQLDEHTNEIVDVRLPDSS